MDEPIGIQKETSDKKIWSQMGKIKKLFLLWKTNSSLGLKINTPISIQHFSLGDYMLLCRCDVTEISFFTPVYASPLLKCNRSAFDFRRDFRSQLSFLSLPPAGSFSSISLNKHKMKVMTNVNKMLSSETSLKIETNLRMEGKASSAKLDTKHKNKLFFPTREGLNIYNLQGPPHSGRSKVRYASTNQQVWKILSLCVGTNTLVQLNGDITVDWSIHGNIPTVRSGEFSQLQQQQKRTSLRTEHPMQIFIQVLPREQLKLKLLTILFNERWPSGSCYDWSSFFMETLTCHMLMIASSSWNAQKTQNTHTHTIMYNSVFKIKYTLRSPKLASRWRYN